MKRLIITAMLILPITAQAETAKQAESRFASTVPYFNHYGFKCAKKIDYSIDAYSDCKEAKNAYIELNKITNVFGKDKTFRAINKNRIKTNYVAKKDFETMIYVIGRLKFYGIIK